MWVINNDNNDNDNYVNLPRLFPPCFLNPTSMSLLLLFVKHEITVQCVFISPLFFQITNTSTECGSDRVLSAVGQVGLHDCNMT